MLGSEILLLMGLLPKSWLPVYWCRIETWRQGLEEIERWLYSSARCRGRHRSLALQELCPPPRGNGGKHTGGARNLGYLTRNEVLRVLCAFLLALFQDSQSWCQVVVLLDLVLVYQPVSFFLKWKSYKGCLLQGSAGNVSTRYRMYFAISWGAIGAGCHLHSVRKW